MVMTLRRKEGREGGRQIEKRQDIGLGFRTPLARLEEHSTFIEGLMLALHTGT
jgi:hypothetical protein